MTAKRTQEPGETRVGTTLEPAEETAPVVTDEAEKTRGKTITFRTRAPYALRVPGIGTVTETGLTVPARQADEVRTAAEATGTRLIES